MNCAHAQTNVSIKIYALFRSGKFCGIMRSAAGISNVNTMRLHNRGRWLKLPPLSYAPHRLHRLEFSGDSVLIVSGQTCLNAREPRELAEFRGALRSAMFLTYVWKTMSACGSARTPLGESGDQSASSRALACGGGIANQHDAKRIGWLG